MNDSQDEDAKANDKIFLLNSSIKSYCDLRCEDRSVHTLCLEYPVEVNTTLCGNKLKVYNMSDYKDLSKTTYEDIYVTGFNGIRNRIAGRMNVGNMIKISFSKYLENMARNILFKCSLVVEKDKCTQIGGIKKTKRDWTTVVMTSFSQEIMFEHPHFIEFVLGTWYSEKNFMERPSFPPNDNPYRPDEIGVISISNNFTYMSHPEIEKVGCQMMRMENVFQFVCALWPYVENRYFYKNELPTRSCPNAYPVQDVEFANLCTGFSVDSRGCVLSYHWILVLFSFFMVLNRFIV